MPRIDGTSRTVKLIALTVAFAGMVSLRSAGQSPDSRQELEAAEKRLAAARESNNQRELGAALQYRGRALRLMGRLKESADSFLEAAGVWDKLGDNPGRLAARGAAAIVLYKLDPARSQTLLNGAVTIANADTMAPVECAQTLHDLGVTAESMNLPDLAKIWFDRALALRNRVEPDSLNVAWTYKKLGDLAFHSGIDTIAETNYTKALEIRQRLVPNSVETAWTLARLGTIHANRGFAIVHDDSAEGQVEKAKEEYRTAKRFFLQSLAIRQQRDPKDADISWTLNRIADASQWCQDPIEETVRYHEQRISFLEQTSPVSPEMALAWYEFGMFFRFAGFTPRAILPLRKALAMYERIGDAHQTAYMCYSLGALSLDLGALPVADFYIRKGIPVAQSVAPDGQIIRWLLSDLARVQRARGETAEAEANLRRVVQMGPLQSMTPPESTFPEMSCIELASLCAQLGKLSESEQYLRRAGEILSAAEKTEPKTFHAPAYTLSGGWGELAIAKGDFAEAERRYLDAYKPFAGHDLVNPVNIVYLIKLSTIAERLGRTAVASDRITLAIREARELSPDSALVASALFAGAEILYGRRDLAGAERLYQEAWAIMQRQLDPLPGDAARAGLSESPSDVAEALMRTQVALGKVDAAFMTMEQARAQTLRKLLSERSLISVQQPSRQMEAYQLAVDHQTASARAVTAGLEAESQLRERLAQADRSAAAPGVSSEATAALTQEKEQLNKALESTAKQIAAARADAAAARAEAEAAWQEVQKTEKRLVAEPLAMQQARRSLPPGVLYVAFTAGARGVTAFLVSAGNPTESYNITIEQNDLNERVQAFRQLVSRRNSSEAEIARTGRGLFQLLFPAQAAAALNRASHVLISPDGPLWDVPFAALPVNASGEPAYLGLLKPIAFTQSLTVFALFGADSGKAPRPGATQPRALIIGDPAFEPAGSRSPMSDSVGDAPLERSFVWGGARPPARLPGTRVEATRVAQLYRAAPLLDSRATERALRQSLATADVIHLATHGYTNPTNPMASGVLLAAPAAQIPGSTNSNTKDDGVLQAREIFGELRLRADLVVLSACETGVGRKVHGEGVIGLTRSLQYAGVRSIVASQWKVADASTGDLMTAFHRGLLGGRSKDEALRAAMAACRKNSATRHPSYWAAFFLSGDSGPLRCARPVPPTRAQTTGAR